jgi:hypothetical protein
MEQRQRSVLLIYGEETESISIRVPKSKKDEIKDKFYEILKGFEDPKTVLKESVVLEEKPKTAKKSSEITAPETTKKQEKKGYEMVDSVPLGSQMINIIGHKCHKHHNEEIYYVKLADGNGFKVVVLHSEKEVKEFIRKELIQ